MPKYIVRAFLESGEVSTVQLWNFEDAREVYARWLEKYRGAEVKLVRLRVIEEVVLPEPVISNPDQ